jgi:hypothetical protein
LQDIAKEEAVNVEDMMKAIDYLSEIIGVISERVAFLEDRLDQLSGEEYDNGAE